MIIRTTSFPNGRRLRPQLNKPGDSCFYHCVSRVVDKRFIFGEAEKEQFLKMMRRYEAFCKVGVVGFVVMSNHFHLMIRVSGRPTERPSEQELLQHVEATLGKKCAEYYQDRLAMVADEVTRVRAMRAKALELDPKATFNPNPWLEAHEKVFADIWQRMYDVSEFMKSLKQLFSLWYNKRMERQGTLWEERFRSSVIEGGSAVAEICAYIDLNPVRAGLVADPMDYRWSQYGAAIGGNKMARNGLRHAVKLFFGPTDQEMQNWNLTQGKYRMLLYRRGLQRRGAKGEIKRGGVFDEKTVEAVFEAKGQISGISYVGAKIRYFTDGAVIGTKGFIEGVFQAHQERFGKNRKTGTRKMKTIEGDWGYMRSLRDLQRRGD